MIDNVLSLISKHTLAAEVFAVVLATALVRYLVGRAVDNLARQSAKTHNPYDDALFAAARKPLGWLVWVLGVTWAAEIIGDETGATVFAYAGRVRDVGLIWMLAWFAIRFIGEVEEQVISRHLGGEAVDGNRLVAGQPQQGVAAKRQQDVMTAKAIAKLLRVSVLITGVLLVMQALGFTISGVLAFGGIGGIAVGFAARDLLANFFGALMIFMDRPFAVGDWVRSPEKDIEGTVEEIGWRLTRIRTFDQRPLYVPNATFASLTVENPSRMSNWRIYETIGLRYEDLAAMPAVVADVEAMLKGHPDIDPNALLMVNFVTFGPASLDFFIYTFTRTTDWAEYHAVKQDVLLKVADVIARHGAEVAFPTQTLHLEGLEGGEDGFSGDGEAGK